MKVGICGTHCAGKTTLATAFSHKYGLPLIQEVAGRYPSAKRQSVGTQVDILLAQVKQEMVFGSFVSDRTVCDNYAYYRFWAEQTGTMPSLDINVELFVRDYLKNYHYSWIFLVDEYFDLEDDGQRDTDPVQQKWVYDFLSERFDDLTRNDIYPDLRVAKIKGTTEERLKQMADCIGWSL